jgi:Cu2+-exporting ATPase
VAGDLNKLGLGVELVSGDQPLAVANAATAAGIKLWRAALAPAEKLARLLELRRRGARVLVVGDGVNDAPSFGAADVSIAMGSGSVIAKSSADIIVLGGDLAQLSPTIEIARRTRRIIRQNLAWALVYNTVSIPLAALGLVPPWLAAVGMSLSSLLVVGNAVRLWLPRARPDQLRPSPAFSRLELGA